MGLESGACFRPEWNSPMILYLIQPHASLLNFSLHELYHLMSRRPPEVPPRLPAVLRFENLPWRLRVSSGRALPQPEAEHLIVRLLVFHSAA